MKEHKLTGRRAERAKEQLRLQNYTRPGISPTLYEDQMRRNAKGELVKTGAIVRVRAEGEK